MSRLKHLVANGPRLNIDKYLEISCHLVNGETSFNYDIEGILSTRTDDHVLLNPSATTKPAKRLGRLSPCR